MRRAMTVLRQFAQIAAREAEMLGITRELATRYLRENLHFKLGRKERDGLRKFYQLCVKHGLAPMRAANRHSIVTQTYGCAAT